MKVFIDVLNNGYESSLARAFHYLGAAGRISGSDRIVIKPNLTFPSFRKGVMTNPEAVEALVLYLKNFTSHITICEADSGGYNRFSMDEVFSATGLRDMAERYGVKIVNLSHEPWRPIHFRGGLRRLSVPLPRLILDETDLFITMPVPKVHSNTGISLSLKNQWGIIQQPDLRLKLHPHFKPVIYHINKALPRSISVLDGKFGLTRNGPMLGDVLELGWLVAGDNLFAVDKIVCQMMGFDPSEIPHLRYALSRENVDALELNTSFEPFVCKHFYLERKWTDYPGWFTFHSRALAYLGYESALARPLHWLLYRFREPFY
jgi:uncharacterized protein (DUF362 family)